MSTQALHTKGFASLLTTFSFTVMTVSGILLFIVPQGRIAEWTNWTILGLSKSDWGNIHITTSLMFLTAGAYHIWCNWRTLVNYFTTKRNASLMMRRELAISAVVTLFFVVGAVYQVPPLSYVLEANNAIKMAWIVDKDHEPPIGHAELLTVKSFTKKMQTDLEQATAALNKGGIRFAENESLAVIAKQQVYTEELVDERFEGRGMGRKTLAMITGEAGMDLARAKQKLAARKMDIKDGETLKEASARMGTAPIELLKIVFVGEPVKI